MSKIDRLKPTKKIDDDQNFHEFKAGMAKRKCCLCGRTFQYDLTPYFNSGKRGYICSTCHMHGPPEEVLKETDSQTTLQEVGEA